MNKDKQGDRLTPVAQRSHNAEKGKVGTCPKGHLTQANEVLHEEGLTLVGRSRGVGLAVRAGRHGTVLRGRHGQPRSHRYCHC